MQRRNLIDNMIFQIITTTQELKDKHVYFFVRGGPPKKYDVDI